MEEGDKNEEKKGASYMGDAVLALLEKIAAKLGVESTPEEPPAPSEGPAEMAAKAPAAPGPKVDYAAKGEIAALKARLDAKDKDENLKAKAEKVADELASYNLGPAIQDELFAIAKKDGEGAMVAFAAAVKKHGSKEPPTTFTGELNAAEGTALPPEVLSYSQQGPEAVEKATASYREYQAMGSRVSHIKVADWIRTAMDSDAGKPLSL